MRVMFKFLAAWTWMSRIRHRSKSNEPGDGKLRVMFQLLFNKGHQTKC